MDPGRGRDQRCDDATDEEDQECGGWLEGNASTAAPFWGSGKKNILIIVHSSEQEGGGRGAAGRDSALQKGKHREKGAGKCR